MEMELCKGEIQAHCTDVSDSALALARSVLSMRDISILRHFVITNLKTNYVYQM